MSSYLPPAKKEQIRLLPTWSAFQRTMFFEDAPVVITRSVIQLGVPEIHASKIMVETIDRVLKLQGEFENEDLWEWVKGITRNLILEKGLLPNWSELPANFYEKAREASLKAARIQRCRDNDFEDDIVQETILRAVQKLHNFRGGDLFGWIFGIAQHVSQELTKQERRFQGSQLVEDVVTPANTDIFDDVWYRELLVQVKKRTAGMSGKEVAVAISRLIDQLEVKEVMVLHKVSANYVYNATRRYRKSLAALSEGLDDE